MVKSHLVSFVESDGLCMSFLRLSLRACLRVSFSFKRIVSTTFFGRRYWSTVSRQLLVASLLERRHHRREGGDV